MGRHKCASDFYAQFSSLSALPAQQRTLPPPKLEFSRSVRRPPTLKRVIPEFKKSTDNKVIAWFGPPAPIVDQILKGDTVDAVFISGPRYDDLVKVGPSKRVL